MTSPRKIAGLLVMAGVLLAPAAQAERPPLSRGWDASIGVRTGYIRSSGFDAFSKRDDLEQLSLALRRTVWFHRKLSLVYGVAWDVGGSDANVRAARTELITHRLGMIIEGRYRVSSLLALYGRVVPGAIYDSERLTDASAQLGTTTVPWTDSSWSWSVDGVAGAALRMLQFESERGQEASFWLAVEGGYGFSPSHSVKLQAELPKDDPRQNMTAPIDMGQLALRGGFFRVSLAISY